MKNNTMSSKTILVSSGILQHLALGLSLFVITLALSWPINFDPNAVVAAVAPLKGSWYKLLILFIILQCFGIVVRIQFNKAYEFISAISFFTFFYPSFSLLAGLPEDIGLAGGAFAISIFIIVASTCTLAGKLTSYLLNTKFLPRVFRK